jgi:hypothetical protein
MSDESELLPEEVSAPGLHHYTDGLKVNPSLLTVVLHD